MQHCELTGADVEAKASKLVTDRFVGLRGALAYALTTQVRLLVYFVSLQRVQEPTSMQVLRFSRIARKLQACLSSDDTNGRGR
eukprot:4691538-Pyramimonas_sp.AAC.1